MENRNDRIELKHIFLPENSSWNRQGLALVNPFTDHINTNDPSQQLGNIKIMKSHRSCNRSYPSHHKVRKKKTKSKNDDIPAIMPTPLSPPTPPPIIPSLLTPDLNLGQTHLNHRISCYDSINIPPHPASLKFQLTCLPSPPRRWKTCQGSAAFISRPSSIGHSNDGKMHSNPTSFLTCYDKGPTKKWPHLGYWYDRLSFPVMAALTYKHRFFKWNWFASNLFPAFLLILTLLTIRANSTPLPLKGQIVTSTAKYSPDVSRPNFNEIAYDTRLKRTLLSMARRRRLARSTGEDGMAEIENFLKNLLPKLTTTSKFTPLAGQPLRQTNRTVNPQGLKARSITRALLKQAALVIGKARLGDQVTEEDDYDNYNYDDDDVVVDEDYPQSYDNLKYQFQKGFSHVTSNSLAGKHRNPDGLVIPKKYSKFHCRNSYNLQIAPDGNVNGTKDSSSQNSLLQITNIGSHSAIQIFGIATKRYLCMDVTGNLYSSTTGKMKKECIFIKSPYGHHYFTLHSIVPHLVGDKNSAFLDKDRFYVGLTYSGHPKPGFKSQRHSRSSHFFATYH